MSRTIGLSFCSPAQLLLSLSTSRVGFVLHPDSSPTYMKRGNMGEKIIEFQPENFEVFSPSSIQVTKETTNVNRNYQYMFNKPSKRIEGTIVLLVLWRTHSATPSLESSPLEASIRFVSLHLIFPFLTVVSPSHGLSPHRHRSARGTFS